MVVARVVAADGHPGAVRQPVHGGLAELLALRLIVVAEHLEGGQIVVYERERVLPPAEVVQGDVEFAVEALEGIEQEEGVVAGLLCEALRGGVGVEILRLEVEDARCGLELRPVDGRGELAPHQVEVAIPHLRLALTGGFAGEVAAQRACVLPQDARHETRARRQRLVRERLLALREVDDLLQRQRLQVHDGQRGVDERPVGALAALHVVDFGDDVRAVVHADELRIVRPLHLRRDDPDQPSQDLVARPHRIPAGGEQRGRVKRIHDLLQADGAGHVPAAERVCLAEPREQDLAQAVPVAVVGDPDEAVPVLDAVGIGYAAGDTVREVRAAPFVKGEAVVPSRAVVGRELGREMTAAGELVVVHQQEIPRG